MKRKADEDCYGSSEQEEKRIKIEDLASDDDKAIEEARTQREIITILKEKLKSLAEREHNPLDIHGRDPQRDVYAFELRALLRQKAIGRWTCPAFDCNQSYTRKSHMKGHIMTSIDAKHRILKSILSEIRCCYCGDKARDIMIISQQHNRENFELDEALQFKTMEHPPRQLSRPQQTDSGFIHRNHDIQTPVPNAALSEEVSPTPQCRPEEQLSKIVEDLSASRSTPSESENGVELTPNMKSPTSAELARQKPDLAQHELSSTPPFRGSQTPMRESYHGSPSVGIAENVHAENCHDKSPKDNTSHASLEESSVDTTKSVMKVNTDSQPAINAKLCGSSHLTLQARENLPALSRLQ